MEQLIKELDIDIDAYLLENMMSLCKGIYEQYGYPEEVTQRMKFFITDPHEEIYLHLRQELRRIHAQDGTLLKELGTPKGARERIEEHMTNREDAEIFEHFTGTRWQNL
jgi:hypothetical protein